VTEQVRYKAIVEYDGTEYIGFQRQAPGRGPTIQGELETALGALNRGAPVSVSAAGRTDTGVHASGQVIAFNLDWRHGPDVLARAVNAHLPAAIAVRSVEVCGADFHPRFSATGRRYRYIIYQAPERAPLLDRFAWRVWPPLDEAALLEASRSLLGRKDFGAFGSAPDEGGQTVREVREARWEASAGRLEFYIAADAFLYRMVRSLVGVLKRVGAGELSPAEFAAIVASADRSQGAVIAPPQGLCLIDVFY
jgi:tRNA pseudouridine38-40 synthase